MHATSTQFDLLEIPSKGGLGVVCIGRDPEGKEHAIKVLHLNRASQKTLLKRARDEARMLSRLDHPNLVRVQPVLEVNGRQAIIMEYVRGVNMEELLRERGRLETRVALTIVRDAARGLEAAWSTPSGSDNRPMSIVHRDIKPGNLMVDVSGAVKVVDFGIAKASFDDREAESAAFVPGSRGYMAPERYDGEDTPRGDVYSLGLTLIELLHGKKPVVSLRWDRHDTNLGDAVDRLVLDDAEEIESELRALLRRMCAYEVEVRPFMADVVALLDALLAQSGPADMEAFAERRVRPVFNARTRLPAQEHPLYPEVRFLEMEPTAEVARRDIAGEVKRMVSQPDFPGRAREVAALLASHPGTDVSPLIALIDASVRPAWMFWLRRPSPELTMAAITALEPVRRESVLSKVRRLTSHQDPRVAEAASAMLTRI